MRHDILDPYTWRLDELEPIDAGTVVADPGHRDQLIVGLHVAEAEEVAHVRSPKR